MDPQPPSARWVYVLGRSPVLDVGDVARRAVDEPAQLVLLSLGYPVTPAQDAVVQEALALAPGLRLWLDAVLVPAPKNVAEFVDPSDEVTLVVSSRERRGLERTIGARSRMQVGDVGRERALERGGTLTLEPDRRSRSGPPNGEGSTLTPIGGTNTLDAVRPDDGSLDEETAVPGMVESESVEALAGREIPEPVLDTVWTREDAEARKQGRLIVYLGAAPGVGKTFAMLSEGQRAKARGTDVVVGVVQTYGRPRTTEMLEGLEVIPPKILTYRGTTFEEMDIEAVIERRPERVLIDELAHTNIPGSRRAKRWEDVLDVLAEGIVVITTLNAQHLASLNDVVSKVTGVRQQETVPDWLLDLADQVELVDMSPHALQRRMIHGNIYLDPRKAELALQRFFTLENLTALRELALMRVANQVDDELLRRWSKAGAPETRERILVCVSRSPVADELVRRGARTAQRTRGDLLVVHATTGEGDPDPSWISRVRRLVGELGGEFQLLETEDDPVESVLSFAYRHHVTQIVVGESLRSRWQEVFRGSFVNRLIRRASNLDVHVIARTET